MNLLSRIGLAILALPLCALAGTTQGYGTGGPIPAGANATSGVVTSDIVLTSPGYVASGNAVTVTLLGLQHDFAGDLQITLSYISSTGSTLQSVDLVNRLGATTSNPYGTAADFGNHQGNGDNYSFNTDYTGNLWAVAACSDPPNCTEPYGDADSLPGVSTDTVNNGKYFTSTTGGTRTNLSYAFAGLSVAGGTWRLTITDAADPNVGSYVGWQISIITTAAVTPASIAAVAGSGQSTNVSAAFASALQAEVTDAYSNPVSGVTVTFTAPSSGASATFSGSAIATAVTNSSGIATSPIPLANSTTGSYTVTASVGGLTPAAFRLTNTSVSTPSTFTTYLGTYGSGQQIYNSTSVVLPLRAFMPGGASQITYFQANLTATSGGAVEYDIKVNPDGIGGFQLCLQNSVTYTPWPLLELNPIGSTVTLSTPLTLGTMQITAYRFALVGGEFQLDITATRSGSFSDQIVILAAVGTNYSQPWFGVDGLWSSTAANAPAVTLSTNNLTFGSQAVGSSASQSITVTNSGSAALAVTSAQVGGTNPGDFTISNGCTSSVAPGGACSISVTFNPLAVGPRSATLSISDNTASSPQSVSLSGTGSSASTPSTFTTYLGTYGSGQQTYNGTSVVIPLRAFVPGGASQITYFQANLTATSGGAVEYDIKVNPDGVGGFQLCLQNSVTYTPWPLLQLNPSGSTVTLSTPLTLGTMQITAYRFALVGGEFQLDITATRSGSFSDQIVILAAVGTNYSQPWFGVDGLWSSTAANAPAVTLSTNSLTFGTQAVGSNASQSITVTNSGSAALAITSAQVGGTNPGDFTISNGCTSSVAPGGACSISVTFDPLAVGSRSATLSISDNTASSPQSVSLSGTGSSASTPSTFTTYLGTYGSGQQTYNGTSVVLPLRAFMPGGASQITYFQANLTATSGGAVEYDIKVNPDGVGGFQLCLQNNVTYTPWPLLELNPSGSTVTLSTPLTLGTMQITAYRFALVGGEFQLDITATRSGSFSDQIVILAAVGTNYSQPWFGVDGLWSNP